jgi:hypothetical protein
MLRVGERLTKCFRQSQPVHGRLSIIATDQRVSDAVKDARERRNHARERVQQVVEQLVLLCLRGEGEPGVHGVELGDQLGEAGWRDFDRRLGADLPFFWRVRVVIVRE